MQHIKEDKLAVMHGLDVIAQDTADLAEMVIKEAGCDGIYFSVQGGEVGRFTEEEYRETICMFWRERTVIPITTSCIAAVGQVRRTS